MTKPFPYRMLYATTRELVDYAADLDMNWIVASTTGHKTVQRPREDPPVYMPAYAKMQPARQAMSDHIEAERARLREHFDYAKQRGLRIIYHSYELSLPRGFAEAYPEIFSPPLKEFAAASEAGSHEQQQTNLCMNRPEARQAITAKVKELCETFPQIDGFSYTNNESATQTQVWHRCDHCRDVPFSQMMKLLHDAVKEGISQSGLSIKLFVRCWGSHETPFKYWQAYQQRVEWGLHEAADKKWLPAFVEATRPEHLHFNPDRDIPAFVELMGDEKDTAFIYKASWADNNLHHPLNPWMGRYTGHEEICELSFEHAWYKPRTCYVMAREMQRRARLCRERGVAGLCGLSASWGAHDSDQDRVHPSRCGLSELNTHIVAALAHDPDVDLANFTANWLRRRYAATLPAEGELAAMLLDSEDVAAEAMNINGIRSTENGERVPATLALMLNSFARYGPMYDDWQERLAPTPENLERIFEAKRCNRERAAAMLARIEELRPQLPAEAYAEFHQAFEYLHTMASDFDVTHRLYMTLWSLREGHTKPTTVTLDEIVQMARQFGKINTLVGI